MQAIITKFYGPTNSKGARIKAECAAGKVFVSYEYGLNTQDAHWHAAKTLIEKMGWQKYSGKWVCGGDVANVGFMFVNDAFDCDKYTV